MEIEPTKSGDITRKTPTFSLYSICAVFLESQQTLNNRARMKKGKKKG